MPLCSPRCPGCGRASGRPGHPIGTARTPVASHAKAFPEAPMTVSGGISRLRGCGWASNTSPKVLRLSLWHRRRRTSGCTLSAWLATRRSSPGVTKSRPLGADPADIGGLGAARWHGTAHIPGGQLGSARGRGVPSAPGRQAAGARRNSAAGPGARGRRAVVERSSPCCNASVTPCHDGARCPAYDTYSLSRRGRVRAPRRRRPPGSVIWPKDREPRDHMLQLDEAAATVSRQPAGTAHAAVPSTLVYHSKGKERR